MKDTEHYTNKKSGCMYRLLTILLVLCSLYSCAEPPLCEAKQDEPLKQYFNTVLDRLDNTDYQRECMPLTFKNYSGSFNDNARTTAYGIEFNSTTYINDAIQYNELVMLHEVLHAIYGYQKEDFKISFKTEYEESEIDFYYSWAKSLIK